MPFSISCPDCDARLTLRAAPADGARLKCPKCSTLFTHTDSSDEDPPARNKSSIATKPSAARRPPQDDDDEGVRKSRRSSARSDDEDEDEERRPRKKKKKAKSGGNTKVLVGFGVGGVVLVLCVVALAVVLARRGKAGVGNQQAAVAQPGNNPAGNVGDAGNAGMPIAPGAVAPVVPQPPKDLPPVELYGDQGGERVGPADARLPNSVMRARRDDTFFKLSNPREERVKGPDAKGKGNNIPRDALLIDYEVVRRGKFDGGTLVIHTEDGDRTEVALQSLTGRDRGTIQLVGVSRRFGNRVQVNSKTSFPKNAEMYVTRGDDRYRPPSKFKVSNSVVMGMMRVDTVARDWSPDEIQIYGKPPPAYLAPNTHPTIGEDVPPLNGWPWKSRFVEPDGRLLGLEYNPGEWNKEKRIGGLVPVFSLDQPHSKPSMEVARPGYAVAGAEVSLNKEGYTYAIRLLFRRVKADQSLDAGDAYTSGWIGTPLPGESKTLANDGRRVIGMSSQNGAVVDRFALVVAK